MSSAQTLSTQPICTNSVINYPLDLWDSSLKSTNLKHQNNKRYLRNFTCAFLLTASILFGLYLGQLCLKPFVKARRSLWCVYVNFHLLSIKLSSNLVQNSRNLLLWACEDNYYQCIRDFWQHFDNIECSLNSPSCYRL